MQKYLEVSGSGVAAQVPDRIDLHLSVTSVRPGVAAALTHVNEQVGALGQILRARGVADEDIRTTSSSVHEEYGGPENTVPGYRASQELHVRVVDVATVADLVAAAVEAVGNDLRLDQLSWGVADESAALAVARAAAVEDARTKAAELAVLVGAAPGELLRIAETSGAPNPLGRFAALAKADTGGFAPERGSSQIAVTVHTRWALL